MIRITRLTDYGIVLLTHIALEPEWRIYNVRDLATAARLPLPTVSKILKALARNGVLMSHRGAKGGYSLARHPEEISVVEIISALDGPIAITDCSHDLPGECEHEMQCPVRGNWQRINIVVRQALENITLAEMAQPGPAAIVPAASITYRGKQTEVAEVCP